MLTKAAFIYKAASIYRPIQYKLWYCEILLQIKISFKI